MIYFYNWVSSLRPVDVEFMRALHEKVNIVPVLGKADCLTPLEVSWKKKKVHMSPFCVHVTTVCGFYNFKCLALARYVRRLRGLGSVSTSFPSVTQTRMMKLKFKVKI